MEVCNHQQTVPDSVQSFLRGTVARELAAAQIELWAKRQAKQGRTGRVGRRGEHLRCKIHHIEYRLHHFQYIILIFKYTIYDFDPKSEIPVPWRCWSTAGRSRSHSRRSGNRA